MATVLFYSILSLNPDSLLLAIEWQKPLGLGPPDRDNNNGDNNRDNNNMHTSKLEIHNCTYVFAFFVPAFMDRVFKRAEPWYCTLPRFLIESSAPLVSLVGTACGFHLHSGTKQIRMFRNVRMRFRLFVCSSKRSKLSRRPEEGQPAFSSDTSSIASNFHSDR